MPREGMTRGVRFPDIGVGKLRSARDLFTKDAKGRYKYVHLHQKEIKNEIRNKKNFIHAIAVIISLVICWFFFDKNNTQYTQANMFLYLLGLFVASYLILFEIGRQINKRSLA